VTSSEREAVVRLFADVLGGPQDAAEKLERQGAALERVSNYPGLRHCRRMLRGDSFLARNLAADLRRLPR
jgi:hypothetical protein